jgi:chromosome partitioning protein
MKTIAVLNFKGGVGKTTFSACMAQALALAGHRVLAIDNDYQHNLTTMLGQKPAKPNIRDIYLSSVGMGARNLMAAIQRTAITDLDLITSPIDLSTMDAKDVFQLKKCMEFARLDKLYDYVFIDNGPGLDRLQEAALHACSTVFVPTELSHFAISGVYEMHRALSQRFQNDSQISGIIPHFYRATRQQDAFLSALQKLFPGRVTKTAVPYDAVFENLVERQQVLFLHRISSDAAFSYIELLGDLFQLDAFSALSLVMNRHEQWFTKEAQSRLERMRNRPSTQAAAMHN